MAKLLFTEGPVAAWEMNDGRLWLRRRDAGSAALDPLTPDEAAEIAGRMMAWAGANGANLDRYTIIEHEGDATEEAM